MTVPNRLATEKEEKIKIVFGHFGGHGVHLESRVGGVLMSSRSWVYLRV